jgi:hypothetical protein
MSYLPRYRRLQHDSEAPTRRAPAAGLHFFSSSFFPPACSTILRRRIAELQQQVWIFLFLFFLRRLQHDSEAPTRRAPAAGFDELISQY